MASCLLCIPSKASPAGQLRLQLQSACKVKAQLTQNSQNTSDMLQIDLFLVKCQSMLSHQSSYKVREPSVVQSTSHHRKRSTQSDTALLPSDVHFQRTPSPVSVAPKAGSKLNKSRGNKVRYLCLFLGVMR